jgi:type I restriction enzyme, S subunit
LRCKQDILPKFLFFYIGSDIFQKVKDDLAGDGIMGGIKKSDIPKIPIPIPSLEEQQQIIKILDEVFESISKSKENAEKNLKNVKELFESYSKEIFSKKNENWEEKLIGELCNLMTGGTPSRGKKEYFEGGKVNWLVSGDIHKKIIQSCGGKITEEGLNNSSTRYLPHNSVMIALNGQGKTRGTVALLKIKATCNQSLVSIYPKNPREILPEYIYSNLNSRYEEIRKITSDDNNDRKGLNMPLIRKIIISYPKSFQEQKSIISKLDVLSKEIKELETIYKQKIEDFEELKKSMLQKAFSGELTKE